MKIKLDRPRRSLPFASSVLIFVSLIAFAPVLKAQEDVKYDASVSEEPGHVLGGHRFLPSVYFPNPFAVPSAEFDLGLGYGNFTRDLFGETRELKVGLAGPKLEGQIKIMKRLMLIVGFTGNIVLGLNGETVGLYGASARYQPRVGLLWEAWRSKRSVLSAGLEWEKPITLQASPIERLARVATVLSGLNVPLSGLTEVNRWRPTARYAHTFNPIFGVVAFAGANFNSESFNDISSSNTQYLLGISLDTDFTPLWNIPAGVTLAYRHTGFISGEGDGSRIYSIGFFENFSQRYNFGFEIGKLEQGDEDATIGAFVTRYYY